MPSATERLRVYGVVKCGTLIFSLLEYIGNKITFLKAGEPAERTGKIEVGDEILFINGTYVGEDATSIEITSMIGRSQGSVSLILQRGSIV